MKINTVLICKHRLAKQDKVSACVNTVKAAQTIITPPHPKVPETPVTHLGLSLGPLASVLGHQPISLSQSLSFCFQKVLQPRFFRLCKDEHSCINIP